MPVRLHIVDTMRAVKLGLCALADQIAARSATDPADWYGSDRAQRTAPTAAQWLLDQLGDGPCCATHDADWARIGSYARDAAARIDRVLGLGRTVAVLPDMPCPWCGGDLVMHSEAGTVMSVSCATGLIDC
ncbi:hypothetical protein ACPXCX_52085, partial [Streptomyces sp. DT225]